MMNDKSSMLMNYGMQLYNFGIQIQNLGNQMPIMFQNIKIQMQDMGLQISNIALQIYNLEMNQKLNMDNMNINNINIGNMNIMDNIQNKMGAMNMQMPIENNFLNQMNFMNNINEIEEECPGQKISIVFVETSGKKTTIIISIENTIENLFKKFIHKNGLSSNYLNNHFFLYCGRKMNPNDKTKIVNDDYYGIQNGASITVVETKKMLGSPGKIYVKIYDKEYTLPGEHDKSLYPLLIKYLEKKDYPSKKKTIDAFKQISVEDFISEIAESKKCI